MKNYLLITIAILISVITEFLLGRYTSDSGRYYFKSGDPSLFDTSTGNLYYLEDGKVILINYKDSFENPKKK
ncbi:hypothetical protein AB670_00651 [Chryseobacterium sp. MOF25P]|uniref:hypothetical protein n=1 Tax=unclassified Chryseobacterium TaxID=2593645 RepID=UPI000805C542|nr:MULTISPECIES: hypothetical protein [unclassified Chryseobacterium]OBW42967.1 hypothetical protein AB670_00651 [Chryseobacterium sp. MOF25P]OBW46932.1 hypothetical protein AB671_00942 [Chryseobacterium sp. BGARF1]